MSGLPPEDPQLIFLSTVTRPTSSNTPRWIVPKGPLHQDLPPRPERLVPRGPPPFSSRFGLRPFVPTPDFDPPRAEEGGISSGSVVPRTDGGVYYSPLRTSGSPRVSLVPFPLTTLFFGFRTYSVATSDRMLLFFPDLTFPFSLRSLLPEEVSESLHDPPRCVGRYRGLNLIGRGSGGSRDRKPKVVGTSG